MKRALVITGLASMLLCASGANAAPIALATVGGVDDLIGGFDGIGNSSAAEETFLFDYLVSQGYAKEDLNYQKIDVDGTTSFNPVIDNPTLWAIDFSSYGVTSPLAFLVKFGNAVHEHYLYENVASLQYGVVDLAQIPAANGKVTITSISHTGTAAVPEPASLSLLGLGLATAVALRRLARA